MGIPGWAVVSSALSRVWLLFKVTWEGILPLSPALASSECVDTSPTSSPYPALSSSAAEQLRISDFIEHSLAVVSGTRQHRKKNIIKTFLFNLHVSGTGNADADKHFCIRSDFI